MEISPGYLLNKKEAKAIVHAHSNYATAISTHGKGIPAFHYMVAMAGGNDIKCAKYATYGTRELSKNIIKASKQKKSLFNRLITDKLHFQKIYQRHLN